MKTPASLKRPLRTMVTELLRKKTVRYLIVGGLVYVFELWIIVWAQHHRATPTEAVALSFTLGLIVSFFLQKLFTFGDKRMHHKIVLRQAFAVGLLVVWNLCFTVIITKAVQSFMPATVARTIALLITTIWNFYLYKTRIFTPRVHNKTVLTERPGILLHFKSPKVTSTPLPEESLGGDRRHSRSVVLLCVLLLVALTMGGWVTSTLKHKILISGKRHDVHTYLIGHRIDAPRVEGLSMNACKGRTILQVVAHADDDLAFINPDVETSLSGGKCIRTVYLTAADHGWGIKYMQNREMGIRAAYSTMMNVNPNDWRTHTVTLPTREVLQVYDSPDVAVSAALIFLRLPDGNLDGNGFAVTDHVSLKKLMTDQKLRINTLDLTTTYTRQSLIKTLSEFIAIYHPIEVRTLGDMATDVVGDHPDHVATGELTTMALRYYHRTYNDSAKMPLIKYIGYPIAGRQPNLTDAETDKKTEAFFTYAQYDYNVCKSMRTCYLSGSSYVDFMSRRYTVPLK